jgi:hypothetical protein
MSVQSQPLERTRYEASEPAQPARPRRSPVMTAWHRVRLAVAEMNYATRRLYELQVPWSIGEQRHSK